MRHQLGVHASLVADSEILRIKHSLRGLRQLIPKD